MDSPSFLTAAGAPVAVAALVRFMRSILPGMLKLANTLLSRPAVLEDPPGLSTRESAHSSSPTPAPSDLTFEAREQIKAIKEAGSKFTATFSQFGDSHEADTAKVRAEEAVMWAVRGVSLLPKNRLPR